MLEDRDEIVNSLYDLNAKTATDPSGYDPFRFNGV
jgi:hypothetical protein